MNSVEVLPAVFNPSLKSTKVSADQSRSHSRNRCVLYLARRLASHNFQLLNTLPSYRLLGIGVISRLHSNPRPPANRMRRKVATSLISSIDNISGYHVALYQKAGQALNHANSGCTLKIADRTGYGLACR